MVKSLPGRAWCYLSRVGRNKETLAMLAILALGAYLRLWQVEHLFNLIHDYDEGAWSLAARFMSQGYLPYRDFVLTHPPLYYVGLASVYKIFGYSFFSGRYLSVVLSLVCIVLIYLTGRKAYHSGAGIAAATLFAVSPEMVYFGRRCVQETMGIALVLLAVYLALSYATNGKQNRLLWCGVCLGLAAATKYTLIPAVVAIIAALAALSLGEEFRQSIRRLGRPMLWLYYACVAVIFYSLMLLFKWVLNIRVSLPFIDPMYFEPGDLAVVVLVFVVPLLVSLMLMERRPDWGKWRVWLRSVGRNIGLWTLVGGTALGFASVTAFFWIRAPQEFVSQTLLAQADRPLAQFPSLIALIRLAPSTAAFFRMACLPIVLAVPLVLVLLNKRSLSRSDCFLSVALFVSLLLCQGFFYLPRYYASIFPFLFLGVSSMVPLPRATPLTERTKAGLLLFLAIFVLCLSLSVALLRNYTGYDALGPVFASDEEKVYEETVEYLEGAGAEKVYATSPAFAAMSAEFDTTLAFDTFALLWLEKRPPAEIVDDLIGEGVDYVILDAWTRYWGYPYREGVTELVREVRRNSRLVRVIAPDSRCRAEVYMLGATKQGIFNGQFDRWVTYDGADVPLGWDPSIIEGGGDVATISRARMAGEDCMSLSVCEDGEEYGGRESTHSAISQKIPFPDDKIKVQILPQVNASSSSRPELVPGIHFMDASGHSVAVGFSDMVDGEEVYRYEEGGRLLVLREAQLHQWSEHTVDVARYWSEAGWEQPEEVTVLIANSAHRDNPGCYALYVAEVDMDDV